MNKTEHSFLNQLKGYTKRSGSSAATRFCVKLQLFYNVLKVSLVIYLRGPPQIHQQGRTLAIVYKVQT